MIAPIGISYFTLILIGYLTDVYWGKFDAEPNFLKLMLFTGYFPQLSSGPFVKYDTMCGELFAPLLQGAAGVALWRSAFAVNNVWVLFDGSLYDLGLDRQDVSVLNYALIFLFVVEHYKCRINVREKLAQQNYLFRLALVLLLGFGVVIFGKYGANYVASAFIY